MRIEHSKVGDFGAGTKAHQPRSGSRSQNRLHVQKALMEYLLLGKVQ
jgi:hypothetical protein